MRLIDADALRARMYHDAFETDSDMQKWDGGCWIRYKMFENAIEDAPTIEPKKGKWIYSEDDYGIDGYHCDKCGFFVPWDYTHKFINYIDDYNFCPNCGADMTGYAK